MRPALDRALKWLALPAAAGAAALGASSHPGEQPAEQAVDADPQPPKPETAAAPKPKRKRGREFLIARVKSRPVGLRDHPGGDVVTKLAPTTEFGDPTAVTVVKRRGRWLGLKTAQLPNRKLGWIRRDSANLKLSRTRTWLKVELGRRRLQLRRGSRVVEQVRVGIGRPQNPTPRGTFSVTDKLRGSRFGPYYGRFILALSGRQPRTPPGWPGGDRLAIHGTNAPGRIGQAASAGCVVAPDPALDKLVEEVPQGAPVVIED